MEGAGVGGIRMNGGREDEGVQMKGVSWEMYRCMARSGRSVDGGTWPHLAWDRL